MAETPSALSGLTVIDLSSGLAGALATMFLADNGARVVRVVSGDEDVVREPDIFAVYDRGAEVVQIDPDADTGALFDLCADSDVVIEDLPPASHERARLGLDGLTNAYPKLVHCSITAYGTGGPLKDEPADHDLVAARTGILASQPSYRDGPIHVAHPVAYIGAGLLAAMGTAAALFQRERTGLGRRVETSLMAGAMLYTLKAAWEDMPAARTNMSPQGGGPFYSIFECADGKWIQLGCIHSGFVDLAAAVIGVADTIASNPEYGDGRWPRDETARQRLFDLVAALIKTRPAEEWINDLQAADVPCDTSQTAGDAMVNPQILHNGLVAEVVDPALGATKMPGLPIILSATPGRVAGPRPESACVPSGGAGASQTDAGAGDSSTESELPLTGVRVMEMANVIAGPVAGRLLADLGADVIKFESLDGDISRPGGGAGFIAFNANKRSVSANTRTDDGKTVARRIAARSDVMLANMRPGATDRMGLDPATLDGLNPKLIQTHITAYGWDGPYSHRPGVDPIAQAITGLQHAQGGYDGPPVYLSILAPCDYTGGALGALGTVLALVARERSGVGQKVDTNLLAAGTIVNGDGFLKYAGKRPRRLPDKFQYGVSTLRRLYRTADGWVYVAAESAEHRQLLDAALAELSGGDLETACGETATVAVLESLASHGVPCAPVVDWSGQRFFSDPQTAANSMMAELEHPSLGTVRLSGNLVTFDGSDTLPRRPTPLLGQHTTEALSHLGYTSGQIGDLYEQGVVKTEPPA